jgi:hypothetical protein
MDAEILLIDEEALRRGQKVAGMLFVLDEADQAGLVSFDQAVARLRKTTELYLMVNSQAPLFEVADRIENDCRAQRGFARN